MGDAEILQEEIEENIDSLRDAITDARDNIPMMVKTMMGDNLENIFSTLESSVQLAELLNQRISEMEMLRHD